MCKRLIDIQKREKAATKGNWWKYPEDVVDHEDCGIWPWHRIEDMEFAYHARQDIPYLLNLIESLREEKERCVD